jgi:hypothetical protein
LSLQVAPLWKCLEFPLAMTYVEMNFNYTMDVFMLSLESTTANLASLIVGEVNEWSFFKKFCFALLLEDHIFTKDTRVLQFLQFVNK